MTLLEAKVARLQAAERDLRSTLAHKENGVAQLKAQLQHQCLGGL